MVGSVDTIEKVAEVAADVASLTQPHHAAPGYFTRRRFDEIRARIERRRVING